MLLRIRYLAHIRFVGTGLRDYVPNIFLWSVAKLHNVLTVAGCKHKQMRVSVLLSIFLGQHIRVCLFHEGISRNVGSLPAHIGWSPNRCASRNDNVATGVRQLEAVYDLFATQICRCWHLKTLQQAGGWERSQGHPVLALKGEPGSCQELPGAARSRQECPSQMVVRQHICGFSCFPTCISS